MLNGWYSGAVWCGVAREYHVKIVIWRNCFQFIRSYNSWVQEVRHNHGMCRKCWLLKPNWIVNVQQRNHDCVDTALNISTNNRDNYRAIAPAFLSLRTFRNLLYPSNTTERNSSREAKYFSATQEIPEMLRSATVYWYVRKSTPLVLTVTHIIRLQFVALKHLDTKQQYYCRTAVCYAAGCVVLLIIQHRMLCCCLCSFTDHSTPHVMLLLM